MALSPSKTVCSCLTVKQWYNSTITNNTHVYCTPEKLGDGTVVRLSSDGMCGGVAEKLTALCVFFTHALIPGNFQSDRSGLHVCMQMSELAWT